MSDDYFHVLKIRARTLPSFWLTVIGVSLIPASIGLAIGLLIPIP